MARKLSLLLGFMLIVSLLSSAVTLAEWPRDLEGRTIRVNTRWWGVTPLGPRNAHNWYEPDARLQAHIEMVEEMFNVNIEFTEPVIHEGSAPRQIYEMFLAGEVNFDYTNIVRRDLPLLVSDNLLRPLTDVLDEEYYQGMPQLFRLSPEITDFMGETYMFESMAFNKEAAGVMWNKSMFEREGLPSLYDIYEAGDWTYDKMVEIAIALTRDTSGDGVVDQFGLQNFGRRWQEHLLITNGASYTGVRDGRVVATIAEPEAIEYFEWFQELSTIGVLGGGMTAGTAGMEFHWGHAFLGSGYAESEDEIGFLPTPRGPSTDEHRVASGNIWLGVIPITEEDPRAVIEVVHALFQSKAPYVDTEVWEDDWWHYWERWVHDTETLDYWRWMEPRVEFPDHIINARNEGFHEVLDTIQAGGAVTPLLAGFAPRLQAAMDELYGQ